MGVKQKAARDAGCLVFFGIPFAVIGAALMVISFSGGGALLFSIGLMFALAGGWVVVWAIIAAKGLSEAAELALDHPDEPWRWRKDWNEGLVRGMSEASASLLIGLAAVVDAMTFPILFLVPGEVGKGNPAALIALLFPLAGVLLTFKVARVLWSWWGIGPAFFQMDQIPGVIGGKLKGNVLMPPLLCPTGDTRIVLECLRLQLSANGKVNKESVWWRTETVVPQSDPVWQEGAVDIPVAFDIPEDQPATTTWQQKTGSYAARWRVRVETPLAGPDFQAQFDVPVFRTPASPPSPDEAVFRVTPSETVLPGEAAPYTPDPGEALPAAAPAPDPVAAGQTLRDAGFQTRPGHRGGIAVVFPPGRQNGALIVFLILFGGLLILIPPAILGPGLPSLLGFATSGSFGLGLIYLALLGWRGTTIVEVCDRGVGVNMSFTGRPPKQFTPFNDIMGLQIEGDERRDYRPRCAVMLVPRENVRVCLVSRLYRHEARAVLDALETATRDYGGGQE